MTELSDRLKSLSGSQTLIMSKRARELREQGKDVISLSIGEPDFDTPDFIKKAAIAAIENNFSKYPPIAGYPDLKKAIIKKFQRDNKLNYKDDQIVVSTGAKQSIANVFLSLLSKGDEVIILGPYWVSYNEMIKMADGTPVPVNSNIKMNFKVSPEMFKSAITEKTKAVIFSSPSNPSGAVYSRDELIALADVVKDREDIIFISDEIYEHINYTESHVSMASIPGMYNRTVTVNGLSKAFAMTGWRIGYIGAPSYIAKACEQIQGQTTSGASSISQMAAIEALNADPKAVEYMKDSFLQRRDLIISLLKEIKGFKLNRPDGAFYILPNISYYFGKTLKGQKINNAQDFSMYLLEQANVAVVSAQGFGAENCIRLSYASSEEELREAVKRIKSVLE
jgi:aspartate aminotransferase